MNERRATRADKEAPSEYPCYECHGHVATYGPFTGQSTACRFTMDPLYLTDLTKGTNRCNNCSRKKQACHAVGSPGNV
jgi:hypothetical protein